MDRSRVRPSAYELTLLAVVLLVFIWSGIAPHDRFTWVLEVFPVILGAPGADLRLSQIPLYSAGYTLIALHAIILMVGGKYTYAEVPLGFWMQGRFGFARNHYDRIGHFAQGFVPGHRGPGDPHPAVAPARHPVAAVLRDLLLPGLQRFYELIEFWTALATGDGGRGVSGDPGRSLGYPVGHDAGADRRDYRAVSCRAGTIGSCGWFIAVRPWPRACRSLRWALTPINSPTVRRLMHRFSALDPDVALYHGCGISQRRLSWAVAMPRPGPAKPARPTRLVQDWETEPPLWVPRRHPDPTQQPGPSRQPTHRSSAILDLD